MDLKEIKELIDLMNEYGLIEIEIEKEGTKIRLKKGSLGNLHPVSMEANILKPESKRPPQVTLFQEESKTKAKSIEIKSPMIGTFYRAPHPEARPFVDVGDEVEVGQVICIIEAMKLMNEIKSEIKGKIIEVLVNNGDPVEFGQPIFRVEPL